MPAQAKPLGAISRMPGLLETNVNAGERVPPVTLTALALKTKVVPTCREALVLGLRVIFTGKGEGPGGLLPPQAVKNRNKKTATTAHTHAPKRKLPMHPLVASRL